MNRKQVTSTLDMVRAVGKKFTEPDEDWIPVLILEGGLGDNVIVGIKLVVKEATLGIPPLVEELFKEHRPTFAALVLTTWVSSVDKESPMAQSAIDMVSKFGPCNDPNRTERVIVMMATATEEETWSAEIKRYKTKPPSLGAWEPFESAQSTGRLTDMLPNAFKHLATNDQVEALNAKYPMLPTSIEYFSEMPASLLARCKVWGQSPYRGIDYVVRLLLQGTKLALIKEPNNRRLQRLLKEIQLPDLAGYLAELIKLV